MLGAEGSADAIAWFRELSDTDEPLGLESLDEIMSEEWLLDPIPFSTQDDNGLPAYPTTAATSSSTTGSAHLQQQPCQNPQGSCLIVATGFLQSIHATSPSCVMGLNSTGRSQPQQLVEGSSCAVDAVLSTTQEASRILHGLVQCRCHESPQLQLLVTVICSEAISWNRRIIATYDNRGTSHRGRASSNMDLGEGDIGLQDENERLVPLQRRPFRVGEHHVEGGIEAMLMGQVVSSRLRELERVVGDVAWKTRPEDGSSEMLLDRVHTRRNGFLHDQLNAARRELASSITMSATDDNRG